MTKLDRIFVSNALSKMLEERGYDEDVLARHSDSEEGPIPLPQQPASTNGAFMTNVSFAATRRAPTYQQVIDWLYEKHGLSVIFGNTPEPEDLKEFESQLIQPENQMGTFAYVVRHPEKLTLKHTLAERKAAMQRYYKAYDQTLQYILHNYVPTPNEVSGLIQTAKGR